MFLLDRKNNIVKESNIRYYTYHTTLELIEIQSSNFIT